MSKLKYDIMITTDEPKKSAFGRNLYPCLNQSHVLGAIKKYVELIKINP